MLASPDAADLRVDCVSGALRARRVGALHFVFAEVEGSLKDYRSGRLLEHRAASTLKGAGSTPPQANTVLVRRAAAHCGQLLLPRLLGGGTADSSRMPTKEETIHE